MKSLISWVVAGFAAATGLMVVLHGFQAMEARNNIREMELLSRRHGLASGLLLELEQYRRASGGFRKLTPAEVTALKSNLKTRTAATVAELERLDPSAPESTLGRDAVERVSELLMTSARVEPQLFTRDAYQKEEIRRLHDAAVSAVVGLRDAAGGRLSAIPARAAESSARSLRLAMALAGSALAMMALVLFRQYWLFHRPARRLGERLAARKHGRPEARTGDGAIGRKSAKLAGVFGEAESVIDGLSVTVESQRKERHQFLMAVANDLRAPLVALQAGARQAASLAAGAADQARRIEAAELVNRSVFHLSRTLEGLSDLLEMDRGELRLDERIVDLRELLERTFTAMGGPGSAHPIVFTAPDMPIWTLIDPRRIECALIHLLGKVKQLIPQGGGISVSVWRAQASGHDHGVEIVIQESRAALAPRTEKTPGRMQDVLQHWLSENGFGIALAQKIVRAHGGAISTMGGEGGSVQFIARLPEERVATGAPVSGVAAVLRGGVGALEGSGIHAMLAQQAVNFGS